MGGRVGYARRALGVPGTDLRGCALIAHNLDALERMIDYNLRAGILFRVSIAAIFLKPVVR